MKTRLVRTGNSRGVRIPKPLIEEAGLTDQVGLEVRGNTMLDAGTPTRFDDTDWQW